ncbi:hypothetical protein DUNSADRAFT_6397 [Dunaliella salina]|uniref:EF-hand domain-containing protein n=1 Tax=Dunaliella salina TaxID=3046 RepID=A0ABQ7H6R2_DUNSA|nr:hypothetical protein DUNSADRAFT_6397 [Dunaliella salina]|eukprot:KAF5842547.1 hypothetical protein DUNSADRAFT_6397 [Dunaliella salina]
MLAALQEVGLLNGIRAKHVGRLLEHEFKKADWDKDGKISLQDFVAYYEKVAKLQTQMAREGRIKSASHGTQIPVGVENTPALKRVFKNYCKYALGQGRVYSTEGVPHMNAQQFHRLCQDAGFVEPEGRLPTTAVDVVYYRYRPVGGRRLAYKEFVEALGAIAYEAGLTFEEVMVALGCRGPIQITPEGSLRGSETGLPTGSSGLTSSGQPAHVDPFSSNLLAQGLSSIQEVPTPLGEAKPKKKKKAKAATAKLSDVGPSHNPLIEAAIAESQQQMLANAQAQLRNELDARLRALEMRSMSGSGGLQTLDAAPGRDAGVTAASIAARLSKLEAQLSHTAVRQDESAGAAQQVASLHAMMAKLSDDVAQLKRSGPLGAENGAGSVSAEAHADLMRQVQNMSLLVGQLAGDVRIALGRADQVSEQVAVLSLEQRKLAAQLAAGGGGNAGGDLPDEEPMLALEKRMAERQARIEGALMQVARQVDMLDSRVNMDPL